MCVARTVIVVVWSAAYAYARSDSPPTWKGRVEISRTGSYERTRSGANQELTDTTTVRYKLMKDSLTLEACGPEGRLLVTRAARAFEEQYELHDDQQNVRQVCPLPEEAMRHNALYRAKHYKPEVKSPGDTQTTREVSVKTTYAGADTPSLERTSSVSLTVSQGGEYELEASGFGYGSLLSDTVTRAHHVCSGKTSVVERHVRTGDLTVRERTTGEVDGEGEGKRQIVNTVQRPSPLLTLGFTAKGRFRGPRIAETRSHPLEVPVVIPRTSDVGQPNAVPNPTYTVSQTDTWTFETKDLCQDAREALATARKFVECYHDPSLVKSAASVASYEGAVEECVRGKARAEGRGGARVGVDAGVDFSDCRLVVGGKRGASFDELRDALADGYRCSPDALLEATVEHERKHMEQCWAAAASSSRPSPVVAKSVNEEEAYCHEAKLISDYLNATCQEQGGDAAATRAICGPKFR